MRWSIVGVGMLFMASFRAQGAPAAPAAPSETSCTWWRLASGERRANHALVDYPTQGVLSFGGVDLRAGEASVKDDVHVLELTASGSGTWRELTDVGSDPGDRADHAAVLRAKPGGGYELVTYGGTNQAPGGAGVVPQTRTHRLDLTPTGGTWSLLDAAGALPRAEHTRIHRPQDDALIVFGGRRGAPANSVVDTTLRLTLDATPEWETIAGSGDVPDARAAHSAVYDAAGDRMVVFGGRGASGQELGDTWALNLAGNAPAWERLATTGTAPTGRYEHAAAYIPALRSMVVYGGVRGTTVLPDLFALDLSVAPARWERITTAGERPANLRGSRAAYASVLGAVVLYGGRPDDSAVERAWKLTCTAARVTPVPTTPRPTTPTPTTPAPTTPVPTTPRPTTPAPTSPTPATTAPASPTATATAPDTETPTTPAPQSIELSGVVYDADLGMTATLAGASIVVPPCQTPHQSFQTTSGTDGSYRLTLPASYFMPGCAIDITIRKDGYQTSVEHFTYEQLLADPLRSFGLRKEAVVPPKVAYLPNASRW
jgi:cell division septation protein DedD